MIMKCLLPKRFNANALLLILVLITLHTSCQQFQTRSKRSNSTAPLPAATRDDGLIHQLAQIESVAAHTSPLDPTKADVTIAGLLHDGATRVQDIQQQKLADGFVITVTTVRQKNSTASLALLPFDRTISVDLVGMAKGMCKVVVNGIATTFIIP